MTILCGVYNKMETEKAYAWPSKTDQDGEYSFLLYEAARDWCLNKPGTKEVENGWKFISDDYEYRIHEILVR